MAIKVDETKCTGCGICVDACHVGAITVDHVAKIDAETCVGCEACVAECPNGALSIGKDNNTLSYPKNFSSPLSGPVMRSAISVVPLRMLRHRLGFPQDNRYVFSPSIIFDYFGRQKGHGYGRGRGQGSKRGYKNRRRAVIGVRWW